MNAALKEQAQELQWGAAFSISSQLFRCDSHCSGMFFPCCFLCLVLTWFDLWKSRPGDIYPLSCFSWGEVEVFAPSAERDLVVAGQNVNLHVSVETFARNRRNFQTRNGKIHLPTLRPSLFPNNNQTAQLCLLNTKVKMFMDNLNYQIQNLLLGIWASKSSKIQ